MLVNLNSCDYGQVAKAQCERVAVSLAGILSPQLYGSRRHGENNAVSLAVKSCTEALFWLNFAEDKKSEDAITVVTELRDLLSNPSLN